MVLELLKRLIGKKSVEQLEEQTTWQDLEQSVEQPVEELDALIKNHHKHLAKYLGNSGVTLDNIAFYNTPEFYEIPTRTATTFDEYINSYPYTSEYLELSKKKIDIICSILYKELEAHPNNLGLCINVSEMLSSILQEEKIGNYLASGAVNIEFEDALQCSAFTSRHFEDGHVWVFAAPYGVIDLTIMFQNYPHDGNKYFPNYITHHEERFMQINEHFGMLELADYTISHQEKVNFYYQTNRTFINGNRLTSGNISSYSLNGKSLYHIYHDLIKPQLEKL